jgi:ferritin-like metal-binding protein YciE
MVSLDREKSINQVVARLEQQRRLAETQRMKALTALDNGVDCPELETFIQQLDETEKRIDRLEERLNLLLSGIKDEDVGSQIT